MAQLQSIFKALPDILKFGTIGLVAIFVVLLFFLFNRNPNRQRFLYVLLPFTIVCIIFLVISSYTVYKFKGVDNDKTIDSLKEELRIYQGSSEGNETLKKKYQKILFSRDSLNIIISRVQHSNSEKETLLNNNVMIQVLEAFETVSNQTSEKEALDISPETLDNLRFKNVVFQKLYDFGADTSILRKALVILKKRGEKINVNELVKDTPKLIQLKRKWINTAILAIDQAKAKVRRTQDQNGASVKVKLPKEVWILQDIPYELTLTDDSYTRLLLEKQLLSKIDLQ